MALVGIPTTRIAPWEQDAIVGVQRKWNLSADAVDADITTYTTLIHELCQAIDIAEQNANEPITGYANIAAGTYGERITSQSSAVTISVDDRIDGIAGLARELLMGVGSSHGGDGTGASLVDADSHASHYNTPKIHSCAMYPLTVWQGLGNPAGAGYQWKRSLNVTIDSIHMASDTGAVKTDIAGTGFFPTMTPPTSGGVNAPLDQVMNATQTAGNRSRSALLGTQMFTNLWIINDLGALALLPATVMPYSLDITMSRGTTLGPNPQGKNPLDLIPDMITLTGSFRFYYEGYGAGTIYNNSNTYQLVGDSGHIHSIQWKDEEGRSVYIYFYPIIITDVTIGANGSYVEGTASFVAHQRIEDALTTTQTLSSVHHITQQTGTAILAP